MKLYFLLCLGLCACSSSYKTQEVPSALERSFSEADKNKPRRIQVFYDGTSNDWANRTNVRRRFEMIAAAEDPFHPTRYVEGVGVNDLRGKAFGFGIKSRVLLGYKHLAKNWVPTRKDEIHLSGFSRGAFQARVLAGLMAHCGLPYAKGMSDDALDELADDVWEFSIDNLRDLEGAGDPKAWARHLAANRQRVADHFPGAQFHNPDIQALILWDTVAALPFTENDELNSPKPGKKQRYKLRPYPNIKLALHALALDEKRERFAPHLLGQPLDPNATKVLEVWFPGAHSDVGGGYEDSNDMAGHSLVWVHRLLRANGQATRDFNFYADSQGLMHHPERGSLMKIVSEEQHRVLKEGSVVDFSVFSRADGRAHPEEGGQHVVYKPSVFVHDPKNPNALGKLHTLPPGPYTRARAKAALKSVGLQLYEPESKTSQSAGVAPLEMESMQVQMAPAP
jgi:uncharacterized protein (DUF2235 family)